MLELMLDGLRAIRAHKLRSALTLTGIVFGVASVVSMFSLIAGIKQLVTSDFDSMGLKESFSFQYRPVTSEVASQRASQGMLLADAAPLLEADQVVGASPVLIDDRIVQGTLDPRRLPVRGVGADYLAQRHMTVIAGRGISALDVRQRHRVAVLGETAAKELFGAQDPIGREFRLGGLRYVAVGVARAVRFRLIPADFTFLERRIHVPVTTMVADSNNRGRVDQVQVTAASYALVGRALRDAEAILLRRHRGVKDYEIENDAAEYGENVAMADKIIGGWNIVLGAIAFISLFVGGMGLFSIMQIAVRERVREIGVRKAVGADDRDILREFLVESLTLGAAGGVLGVLNGAGVILIAEQVAARFGKQWDIPLSIPAVVLGLGFALLVGLVFGLYPARTAAKLDPIEAIRQ